MTRVRSFFFFFSSRRRHTRYWRDWSSDVCSSDLVKSSCPLCLGLHTCYNGWYNEQQSREGEQNLKASPSSDCRLKLAYMKLELLVIANQHVAVNTFPGLVHTARHTMRAGNTRSP